MHGNGPVTLETDRQTEPVVDTIQHADKQTIVPSGSNDRFLTTAEEGKIVSPSSRGTDKR